MNFLPTTEGTDASAPAYERAFATRPEVYAAWRGLAGTILAGMDARLCEVATLGAARALRSTYCSLAHGAVLLERHLDEQALLGLVDAADTGAVDEAANRDEAVAAFAARVARSGPDIDQADIDALLAHGLTEQEVLDIVLAAAARCFFSTVLDATGTLADADLAERLGSGLTAALASGRSPRRPGA